MNATQTSSVILVAIAALVSAFQIALAAGAPWGEWAFGGQHKGKLPNHLRISSVISLALYALQVAHFGYRAGWWSPIFGTGAADVLDWVFVVFFALGTVMNGISRSRKERFAWTPVVALSLVCATLIAL